MLVFHALETDGNPADTLVSKATAQCAVGLLRRLAAHAMAVYSGVAGASGGILDMVRAMGLSMLADHPQQVSRTYFTHHCLSFRTAPDWARTQAISFLVDANWLIPDESARQFGGTASLYFPAPAIYARFGKAGEAHRERRDAVKRAIQLARETFV
jgi:hypothetical protein